MKTVTLVVEIVIGVSDDVDADLLHLNNGLGDFKIEEACNPIDYEVMGFTTVNVIDDNENS